MSDKQIFNLNLFYLANDHMKQIGVFIGFTYPLSICTELHLLSSYLQKTIM